MAERVEGVRAQTGGTGGWRDKPEDCYINTSHDYDGDELLDFGRIRLRTYPDIRLCYLANAMLVTIFRFLYCTTVVEVRRCLVLSRTIHTALEQSR